MYIEWWNSDNREWCVSKIPLWVFLWGRLWNVIGKAGSSRTKYNMIHVPRSHIEFI